MWQPIETAPKIGELLLAWPYWSAHLPVIGWWQHDRWISTSAISEGPGPTHWQPLPTMPGEADSKHLYISRLETPINVAINDLLIIAEDYDEEATDTAEILYNAAVACGINVSEVAERMAAALKKFHDMSDLAEGDDDE
jgi:hypothetical protein